MGVIWKWVVGYKNHYRVSSDGRIRSISRTRLGKSGLPVAVNERTLVQFPDPKGYLYVGLCKNGKKTKISVHRIVAKTLIPNTQNKPEVNHKDFNTSNNRVTNLEWVTREEHSKHTKQGGRYTGRKNRGIKLSKNKVILIKRGLKLGIKRKYLSLLFRISYHTVTDIALQRTWSDI